MESLGVGRNVATSDLPLVLRLLSCGQGVQLNLGFRSRHHSALGQPATRLEPSLLIIQTLRLKETLRRLLHQIPPIQTQTIASSPRTRIPIIRLTALQLRQVSRSKTMTA